MSRRSLLIVVIFSLCIGRASSATDWKLVHERTVKAMDHLYNLEFSDAERACNEVIKLAPRDPRGHFFKAMTYYYRMTFRGGASNDSMFWAFAWHADRVKSVCERLLEQNENDGKAMFYMGGAIGYKGLAYVNRGESLRAIWEGKAGYDLLEKAVEQDPDNYDAKMGLGLFRHLISRAPETLKPAISLAGLTGDRYGGLKMIEEAAAKGTYARQEARRWLSELYMDEDMPQRAASHLKTLKDAYPGNWFVWYRFGDITAFQVRKISDAQAAYEHMATMDVAKEDLETVRFIAHIRLGMLSEAREQFGEAIKQYERARQLAALPERREQAQSMIEWAQRLAANEDSDQIKIDRVSNALGVGLYTRVVQLGDSLRLASAIKSVDTKRQLLYYMGTACVELGRYDRAEDLLSQAIQGTPAEDYLWLAPFSHYKLGIAMARQDKTAAAKQQFERALEFEDYPSESVLRLRIRRETAAISRR